MCALEQFILIFFFEENALSNIKTGNLEGRFNALQDFVKWDGCSKIPKFNSLYPTFAQQTEPKDASCIPWIQPL